MFTQNNVIFILLPRLLGANKSIKPLRLPGPCISIRDDIPINDIQFHADKVKILGIKSYICRQQNEKR